MCISRPYLIDICVNCSFSPLSACSCSREELGIPKDWSKVERWIFPTQNPTVPVEVESPLNSCKNKEIQILEDYKKPADSKFWEKFPAKKLPEKAETDIDVEKLAELVFSSREGLTECQLERAKKAIFFLRSGGSSFQKEPALPGIYCENAKATFKYGATITDNIATWIKSGFAAGPFDQPPTRLFRVNSILATKQKEKVRTVLNVSLPENRSLNDNIDETKMEKVIMTSARNFGYTMCEAGKNSWFAKTDMRDAYKNVPIPTNELRLQGFSWLGKFFVETRQIFGAKSAVSNFDVVGQTILDVTIEKTGIPKRWVHRQLDDVPVVAPKNTNWCQEFEKSYKEVCETCNIKLAPNCKNFDKAFSCSQYGKVLGIWFDSKNLRWSLPEEKAAKTKTRIAILYKNGTATLNQMQKLMGSINDVCLMCPFLKVFKKPLNKMLGFLQRNPEKTAFLSSQAKKDLRSIFSFLNEKDPWMPIPNRPYPPPMTKVVFTSDAAGCNKKTDNNEKVGCASIGLSPTGKIIHAEQLFWDMNILKDNKDSKGKTLGSKTTTLEMLGMLLPFLSIPNKLKNKHIVLQVDNISCLFAWESRHSRDDEYASILVRSMHFISAYIGSQIHVVHLPRVSTWEAELADRLSRKSSTTTEDRKLLKSFNLRKIPEPLETWMKKPFENWDLPTELLKAVKERM